LKNKTLANWNIGILVALLWGGFTSPEEGYWLIVGIAFYVFSIMAIVRLYKLDDKKHD
jgi:hypothetical protein